MDNRWWTLQARNTNIHTYQLNYYAFSVDSKHTVDALLSFAVSSLITGWEKSRSAPLALTVWPAPGLRTTMSSALVELMVGEEEVGI